MAVCLMLAWPRTSEVIGHVLLSLPLWGGLILMMIIGPAVLLGIGVSGVPIFFTLLLMIGACACLSRYTWRAYPESEFFAVPIVAAVLMWGGLPLLLLAAAAI